GAAQAAPPLALQKAQGLLKLNEKKALKSSAFLHPRRRRTSNRTRLKNSRVHKKSGHAPDFYTSAEKSFDSGGTFRGFRRIRGCRGASSSPENMV
ncbi:MAG TPA: hypothetical protein H9745_01790, partial [Candidatus Agathobaculum stercoravium]|nr:hypothetical protein [Candidatus Agathobaculum stercoravium]